MIYEVEGHFVISSGGVWLPGAYIDRKAAQFAFQFPYDVLLDVRDTAVARGDLITSDDLRAARKP